MARGYLTDVQIDKMIVDWDNKTYDEWAVECGVHRNTIISMSKEINAADSNLCPVKTVKRKTRKDRAMAAVARFKAT